MQCHDHCSDVCKDNRPARVCLKGYDWGSHMLPALFARGKGSKVVDLRAVALTDACTEET
eukprot:2272267-Amphidinium_carterae.2